MRALPIMIDADAVLQHADPTRIVDAFAIAHRQDYAVRGRLHAQLPRDARPDAQSLIWLGSSPRGSMAMKYAVIFPDNIARSDSATIHSAILLNDAEDGSFKCAIFGNSFTRCKAAADSALGARLLAPRNPETMLLIGAGSQAAEHARFMCAEFPSLRRLAIWNRTPERARQLSDTLEVSPLVSVAKDLEAAAGEADLIICTTSSETPVLRGAWLKPGCHVDLTGSFTPFMREADDIAILRSRVYADHLALVMEHCGDISQPLLSGVIQASHLRGDLFALCRGTCPGRTHEDEITLFKNGGGGHLDLMLAEWLHDNTQGSKHDY